LAQACVDIMLHVRGRVYGARVAILVGGGNTGGDALFAGAQLAARGAQVEAVCASSTPHAAGMAALVAAGGRLSSDDGWLDADIVLDGLVGIGARGALREPAASLVAALDNAAGSIVAVDLPSGVDADTGAVAGVAVRADVTVTFGCNKPGLFLAPEFVGAVRLVDIGLDPYLGEPVMLAVDDLDVALALPEPEVDVHKYRRGVVGVAAGSGRYPGAAVLCVGAARHLDVGMVEILDRRDGVVPLIHAAYPDVVAIDDPSDARITCWVVGPGFVGDAGDHPTIEHLLDTDLPVVLDAGALQVVADSGTVRDRIRARGATTVLTPHDGEFARIMRACALGAGDRWAETTALAEELQCIVVRKGPGTIIATPEETFVDRMGTSALATAGSGDVLAGILGAMVAKDVVPDALAVASGVWVHGMAGRLAAQDGFPVNARDLLVAVPEAVVAARRGAR
jgi:ADP-dependent NAD(P)H-hydrate dehydratase / NAD(P)H-hydrate epimerase